MNHDINSLGKIQKPWKHQNKFRKTTKHRTVLDHATFRKIRIISEKQALGLPTTATSATTTTTTTTTTTKTDYYATTTTTTTTTTMFRIISENDP